jgi:hypothetical protein
MFPGTLRDISTLNTSMRSLHEINKRKLIMWKSSLLVFLNFETIERILFKFRVCGYTESFGVIFK